MASVHAAAVLGILLVLAATIGVSGAHAAFIHPSPPSEAFGTDGTSAGEFTRGGGGLAVNPDTHRLYAFQDSNSRLYAFEIPSAGTHTAVGGNFPVLAGPEFGVEKSAVAVDTDNGNVYTADKHSLQGFAADGEVLPGFPVTSGLSEPAGVGVDADGNVWVADQAEKQIRQYNGQGEVLRVINVASVYEPEFGAGTANSLAVDKSTGDLYFALSPNYGANRVVFRLAAASGYAVSSVEEFVVNPGYPGITDISIDSSRHVIYLTEGTKIAAYNTSGALLEEFGTTMESVSATVDESTGIVYATVFNEPSHQIQVLEPEIVPDALTGEPTGDRQVSGTVGDGGGPSVTNCEFEWGPTTAYGEAPEPCSPAGPYGDSDTVTAELPGLNRETTYHYRLVATNANGTNIGIDRTITPHNVPFLRTTGASAVGRTCATLNGAFDGNGEDTHYNFEWGTTQSYGNTVFAPPGADAGPVSGPRSESEVLCGLQPATTYHYRFIGSNPIGASAGRDATFTTKPAVIDLSTDGATEIGGVAATIRGHWTGDGTPTSYYFEWGFSKNYANSTEPVDVGSSNSTQSGSAGLTGLFQNTVYHYRIVVTNGLGTTYGPDRSFRTLVLASFTYQPANKLTTSSAELHATVNPENAGPTTYHFEYGPTDAYGTETAESGPVGSDNTPHPVAAAIAGLSPGQTYHFRIVATSPAGVSEGPDATFTVVPNLPAVLGASVSGVTGTEASLTAEATPGFGPTVVFFRYGKGGLTAHSLASSPIGSDDSPHSATIPITGLQPGTTYVYRAVAVNVAGSATGPEQQFTTADRPSADLSGVTGITETTATLTGLVGPNRAATTYHFEYATGGGPWTSTAETAAGSDELSHRVTAPIAGLTPGAVYRYRLVAVNPVGAAGIPEGEFTTVAAKGNGQATPPKKCRKGFVKRNGKCVKKPKKKKHRKKAHGKAASHG